MPSEGQNSWWFLLGHGQAFPVGAKLTLDDTANCSAFPCGKAVLRHINAPRHTSPSQGEGATRLDLAYGAYLGPPDSGHCALMVEIAGTSPAMTNLAATSFAPVTTCRIFGWSPLTVETTAPLVGCAAEACPLRSEKVDSGKMEKQICRHFLGISYVLRVSHTRHSGVENVTARTRNVI